MAYPWRFHFHFNEIKSLVSRIQVEFKYVERSANALADSMPKLGVDRSSPLFVLS